MVYEKFCNVFGIGGLSQRVELLVGVALTANVPVLRGSSFVVGQVAWRSVLK